MVQKECLGIVMPTHVAQYHWVDTRLLGIISLCSNTRKLEDSYKDVGPPYDWYLTHVNPRKRYVFPLINASYLSMNVCFPGWDSSFPSTTLGKA